MPTIKTADALARYETPTGKPALVIYNNPYFDGGFRYEGVYGEGATDRDGMGYIIECVLREHPRTRLMSGADTWRDYKATAQASNNQRGVHV